MGSEGPDAFLHCADLFRRHQEGDFLISNGWPCLGGERRLKVWLFHHPGAPKPKSVCTLRHHLEVITCLL